MTFGAIHIGCSGWNYRHWRGRFYPEKMAVKRWFEHYSGVFSTVELNTSFYRLPKPETFAKWRDQAPKGFRYAVKAPRFITHMKKLKDCSEPVEEFLARARNLWLHDRAHSLPAAAEMVAQWRTDRSVPVAPSKRSHPRSRIP
jgi:uncharacterized protein YecE (DUF72 family)